MCDRVACVLCIGSRVHHKRRKMCFWFTLSLHWTYSIVRKTGHRATIIARQHVFSGRRGSALSVVPGCGKDMLVGRSIRALVLGRSAFRARCSTRKPVHAVIAAEPHPTHRPCRLPPFFSRCPTARSSRRTARLDRSTPCRSSRGG